MARLNREGVLRDQIARMKESLEFYKGLVSEVKAQVEEERLDGKVHDSSAARILAIANRSND